MRLPRGAAPLLWALLALVLFLGCALAAPDSDSAAAAAAGPSSGSKHTRRQAQFYTPAAGPRANPAAAERAAQKQAREKQRYDTAEEELGKGFDLQRIGKKGEASVLTSKDGKDPLSSPRSSLP